MTYIFAHGYKEYKESGEESISFTGGGKQYTRIFKGPWEFRHAFINKVLAEDLVGDTDFPLYVLGRPHPEDPNSYVSQIRIRGTGFTTQDDETNTIKHARATITATYESYSGATNPTGDPRKYGIWFIEEEVSPETEILELEADYQIDKVIRAGSEIKVPGLNSTTATTYVQYTNYKVKIPVWYEPPWPNLLSYTGFLNSDHFESLGTGLIFAAKTLQFVGPHGQTQRASFQGLNVWGLDLLFKHNPMGWHLRPKISLIDNFGNINAQAPIWEYVEILPNPYQYAAFLSIFPYLFKTVSI